MKHMVAASMAAVLLAGAPGRLALFESNAFGNDGPYGGKVTTATVDGDRLTDLKTVVAGLNDPSSGVVANGRVYFIESKYPLLKSHPNDDAAIPRGVPFDLSSVPLDDGTGAGPKATSR